MPLVLAALLCGRSFAPAQRIPDTPGRIEAGRTQEDISFEPYAFALPRADA